MLSSKPSPLSSCLFHCFPPTYTWADRAGPNVYFIIISGSLISCPERLGASPWALPVWLLGGGWSGSQWCFGDHEILFKSLRLGWRVVSEVKSTGSSSRGPGFSPQPPHILHRHRSDSTEHPTVCTLTPVDPDAATWVSCPLYLSVHRAPGQELLLRAHVCLFIITVFLAI